MMKQKAIYEKIMWDLVGTVLFSAGVHTFISGNGIAPGGVTGIATILNYLFGMKIGFASLIINVPLLLMGFIFLGRKMVIRTLGTILSMAVIMDFGVSWLPVYHGNIFLGILCGGALMGCGLSLILYSGSTTGGGDLLGRVLQLKYKGLSMGKILLTIDFTIISLSAIVRGEVRYAMYGILTMAICSFIVDCSSYAKKLNDWLGEKFCINNKA